MKIKNLIKQFRTSKINLVSSQVLSEEKNDSDVTLISDIYYDSGIDKSVFEKLYLATAKRFFTMIKERPSESEILFTIRNALRLRRYRYLPDGVQAEDVHGLKDVWTFATFLSGFLLSLEDVCNENLLMLILDKQVVKWLEDKGVWMTLLGLRQSDVDNPNVAILHSFYLFGSDLIESNNLQEVTQVPVLMPEPRAKQTNKDIGELCLKWLYRHADIEGKFSYIHENKLVVKTPIAFIEYGKEAGYSWKVAQKGLIKLNKHEPNSLDGSPFRKIGMVNVLVIRNEE